MDPQLAVEPFFTTFLLKTAARCNIACTYCYEYRLADQSWREKPPRMSDAVMERSIDRVVEHVIAHQLPSINIVFHGGEPLLCGQDFLRSSVLSFRERLLPHCSVSFGVQSNGLLVDESWLDLLADLGVTIGISVDGPRENSDRFRIDHEGRSTHARVEKALRLVQQERYRKINAGMLCVIQPDSNPVEVLQWFSGWGRNSLDLLFPHYNYQTPPPYSRSPHHGFGFGLWLANAFDHWWENDLSDLRVRVFEDIVHLLLGGRFSVESLGLSPVRIVVIQTDGHYEALDSLKSTFDGAVRLNRSVGTHKLDDVLDQDLVASRIFRSDALCDTCRRCRYVAVCGGGYIPHRYHPTLGFAAPSVYCQDLLFLISRIEERLKALGDPDLTDRLNLRLASGVVNTSPTVPPDHVHADSSP